MLINAQRPEELRVAIVQGNVLENYKVDVAESGLTRGNIYRGVIASIQPSLNAAFIDYGAERHGFLAIQDVVPDAYYRRPSSGHPRIDEVLEKGKPIVVQVEKDPIGHEGRGAHHQPLPRRPLSRADPLRGHARRLAQSRGRGHAQEAQSRWPTVSICPTGCGVILRTNALGQTKITLNRDLSALLRLWKRVQTAAMQGKGTRLLYTDQDLILQALRDYLDTSIEEVLVDDDEAFHKAEGLHRGLHAALEDAPDPLCRAHPPVQPLRPRAADRPHLRAPGGAAERRLDRHRRHRGADRDRRQLRPLDPRRHPGGDGPQHQRRGGRRGGPPAPAARHRRHRGGRLHRHARLEEPAQGREGRSRTP